VELARQYFWGSLDKWLCRTSTLQLPYEIRHTRPTPAAINLLLKSHDVTIPNYDIIAQFRHCASFRVISVEGFSRSRKPQGRRRRKYVEEVYQNDKKYDESRLR